MVKKMETEHTQFSGFSAIAKEKGYMWGYM